MRPSNLLVSVRDADRHLDDRLALAVVATRPDRRVVLGDHPGLMGLARRLDGGVFVDDGPDPTGAPDRLTDYRLLKRRGFVVVHCDAQPPPVEADDRRRRQIVDRRIDPRRLAADDFVCTAGDFQRDIYRRAAPPCADNIRTTGQLHLDMYRRRWRPYLRPRADRLNDRFGDFLLVTTDASRVTDRRGRDFASAPAGGFDPSDLVARTEAIRDWTLDNRRLSHLVRLIHRLAVVFSDTSIVVRPRPGEDLEWYRRLFRGLDNVHVDRRGSLPPWLMACRCLIDTGTEAGLQARLADVETINYRPVGESPVESSRRTGFGLPCRTDDQIVGALVELLYPDASRHRLSSPTVDERTRRLVHNLSAPAFPAMMSILAEAHSRVATTETTPRLPADTRQRLHRGADRLRRLVSGSPTSGSNRLADRDVDDRIRRLRQVTGRNVDHRFVGPSLMVVQTP